MRLLSHPSRQTRHGAQPRGFTLVELLVVVSVIALLIALLLPAMSKAIFSARLAKCLSDKRQITLSAFLYGNDYKDRTPSDTDYPKWNSGADKTPSPIAFVNNNTSWMLAETPVATTLIYVMGSLAIRQYVTDPSLFHCADFPRYQQTNLIPSWAGNKVAFDRPEYAATWRSMSSGGSTFPGQVGGSVVHYMYSGTPAIPNLTFSMISDNWQANTTYGQKFTPWLFSCGYINFGGQVMQAHPGYNTNTGWTEGIRMNTSFIDGSAKSINMADMTRKYLATLTTFPNNNGGQNSTILTWARLKNVPENRP